MTQRNRKRHRTGQVIHENQTNHADDDTDAAKNNQNDTTNKIRTPGRAVLSGITVAVSTLKSDDNDDDDSQTSKNKSDASLSSYHGVCNLCKSLGAAVMGQVCKRVDVLISTETAAANATQRIRKAIKKGKPIVSVDWLQACRSQKKRLDIDAFRLESIAQNSIRKRTDNKSVTDLSAKKIKEENKKKQDEPTDNDDASDLEYATRTIDLGCCCVCHELGTDKDCEWCVECPVRLQIAAEK